MSLTMTIVAAANSHCVLQGCGELVSVSVKPKLNDSAVRTVDEITVMVALTTRGLKDAVLHSVLKAKVAFYLIKIDCIDMQLLCTTNNNSDYNGWFCLWGTGGWRKVASQRCRDISGAVSRYTWAHNRTPESPEYLPKAAFWTLPIVVGAISVFYVCSCVLISVSKLGFSPGTEVLLRLLCFTAAVGYTFFKKKSWSHLCAALTWCLPSEN